MWGHICFSMVFAGQYVSVKQVNEAVDSSVHTGQSVNHVSGIRCKPCDRNTPAGFEPAINGLKVRKHQACLLIYQPVTGAPDAPICSTVHNSAGPIHAKFTQSTL